MVDDGQRLDSVRDENLLILAERLEKQNEEEAKAQKDAEMESAGEPYTSSIASQQMQCFLSFGADTPT